MGLFGESSKFHKRLLSKRKITKLIKKNVYKFTVSLTMVLSTSDKLMSRNIAVAKKAVLLE